MPDGTQTFAYDERNLVREITFKDGSVYTFTHDALMRLDSLTVTVGETSDTTCFVWDKDGLNLLAEKDTNGNVIAEYLHGYSPVEGIGTLIAAKKFVDSETFYQYPQPCVTVDYLLSYCT